MLLSLTDEEVLAILEGRIFIKEESVFLRTFESKLDWAKDFDVVIDVLDDGCAIHVSVIKDGSIKRHHNHRAFFDAFEARDGLVGLIATLKLKDKGFLIKRVFLG